VPSNAELRVLVVHNRYRVTGGEERAVALQAEALARAGIEHRLLERRSDDVGRAAAGAALVRGGRADAVAEVGAAVRELRADVAHFHNIHPSFGPRAIAAAKRAGAATVLHLHNFRLFCAIGVASRDGEPCFRCRGRRTLPGVVLNCRGSLPEAAAYGVGLSLHQPDVFRAVDRFVAPSRSAAEKLVELGLPEGSVDVLRPYLPEESFASGSTADRGEYALVASRLAQEKGIEDAIRAAAAASVPLLIAGDGPSRAGLERLAAELGGEVTFRGAVDSATVAELLRGAAMLVMPSRFHETGGYAALEAMAAGVPVVASRIGALPELLGNEGCVPVGDVDALAERMCGLWADPARRARLGAESAARARAAHGEPAFLQGLLRLYAAAAA
jgi:glycosyltransferase involved in cell wall biosynthesis